MKIIATDLSVIFEPETPWEVEQLKRLDHHRNQLTGVLIEAPNDTYPPTMKLGAQFAIKWPDPNDWGT